MITTADVLRLAFAVVVLAGGVLELKRAADERAALLNTERERTRKLGELSALRADFSAMVAHELGGPVAAVKKLNEMISARGEDPALRAYATSAIRGETSALETLVKDVRAAAAVEHDGFAVQAYPVPLSALLSESSVLAGSRLARVVFEDGLRPEAVQVLADPGRAKQVLRNLVSNAVKYSPEGAPVEIRVSRRNGRVSIEVADEGPGIDPQDLRRIFEKFGRGRDASGAKVAGVGLGLYLSRRIARAHGSDLTVRTQLGEGSVFGFDLEVVG